MIFNKKYNVIFSLAFWLGLLLLYILFPTQTHSVDAWGFAANAKYGQDLFSPHHLLYNYSGFVIKKGLNTIGFYPDVLHLLIFLNGIFAWLSIIVLYYIVKKLGNSQIKSIALSAIAAFSFGIWRFATENEAYILPLFFSLLASYFLVLFYKNTIKAGSDNNNKLPGNAFLSGLFAAFACLFHQIHIFWWLGLCGSMFFLTFRRNIKFWLIFSLPFILVPLIYIIVLYHYYNQPITFIHLWKFINHDVYSGAVGGTPGLKHIALGLVNLFRSFIQLHGSLLYLLKHSLLYILSGIIALVSMVYASVIFWRNHFKVKAVASPVFITHLIIFVLQWLFAVYNVGNAEFMVMLPALLVIMLAAEKPISVKGVIMVSIALFCWNFFFGIWPNYKYRFSADESIAEVVSAKPGARFVLAERGIIFRKLYYFNGKEPENTFANPAYYASRPDKNINLKATIDSLLNLNIEVYTDCTGRPAVLNRALILDNETDKAFFKNYYLKPIYTFNTLAGQHFLYKIVNK